MAISYPALLSWKIPEVRQQFSKRDTMLYALGVGLGANPVDRDQLRFVYEQDLQALPTMATILGYPGRWHADPATGVTATHTVLGGKALTIDRALPVEGAIVSRTEIASLIDKGAGKGALITTESIVSDEANGGLICVATQTIFCRADGGFGGPTGPAPAVHQLPHTEPHHVCDIPTLPQAALIYRLSGDYHELHADPAYAQRAGFQRPILQGRCTFSVAGHAILKTCCRYDASRFKSMAGRFSSPVYPAKPYAPKLAEEITSPFARLCPRAASPC